VVELGMLCAQAGFDVAQALATGELRKCHGQILVEAAEALELVLAAIARATQRRKLCSGRWPMTCAKTRLPEYISPLHLGCGGRVGETPGPIQVGDRLKSRKPSRVQCVKPRQAINTRTPVIRNPFLGRQWGPNLQITTLAP
jgi:hypothetical protein